MIAEGTETPGGESGAGPEGRPRRSEGDLLAERRARRAAESGEHALTLRAEAAEATVRTLETHVASLQQRLREVEEEQRRAAETLQAQQSQQQPTAGGWSPPPLPSAEEIERELRRVSQREYAEQRLRIEAEDRCVELERDSRAEIDRLSLRLSASEREARALATRLETAQRELAEAEQSAASELAALRSTPAVDPALQARLGELERRALQVRRSLEVERAARLRAEHLLEAMRASQRTAAGLLAQLGDVVGRLRQDISAPAPAPAPAIPAPEPAPAPERPPPLQTASEPDVADVSAEVRSGEMAEALAAAVQRLRARVEEQQEQVRAAPVKPVPHKHSMSLITRWRLAYRRRREARKQRR